jgi:hypothetical protein
MRTRTTFFDFSRLAGADGANIVARIAMVCNDLATANSCLGHFKKLDSKPLNHIRRGAMLYFVRMSCGHLREGIKAITQVTEHPVLTALVNKCDTHAQSALAALRQCLHGGRDHETFKKYVTAIRDNVSFHYGSGDIKWALEFGAAHPSSSPCSTTIGEDIHSNRFEFADVVLDTIVCRKLWDIPLEAEEWCFRRSLDFLDFGGDFVSRFLSERAS